MSSSQRPLLSVLVPSLNSGRYIREALESVLRSNLPMEVIVQDGGSTDDTRDIVAGMRDERIRLISEPDEGQADALNRALAYAQGEFVLWLNADDVVSHKGIEEAMASTQGVDFVYGGSGLIDAEGRRLKTYRPRELDYYQCLRTGTYLFSGSLVIRPSLLRRLGGFAPLDYCLDFDLLLKLARSRAASRKIEQVIGLLRIHPASKGEQVPWSFFVEHWRVAWKERTGTPRIIPTLVFAQMKYAAYLLTRPLWRSTLWRTLRPIKTR
jgi:glycosyltransferase involved in cell wall biosynthesis